MGIIQRQALRSTVINFIGIGFSTITRLLMPFFLEKSQIGVLALLDSISGLFVVGLNLGYNLILKKLFPKYRNEENGHAGFLALGIILSFTGILIGILFFVSFKDQFLNHNNKEELLLNSFVFVIPILIFFRILFLNLDGYIRMLFKTVIGTFLEGFVSKIIFLVGICLFVMSTISFDGFVYFYCLSLSLPGLVVLFYSFFLTKKIVLPSKELLGESKVIKAYVLFGILSGASGAIIQYIDVLMIKNLILEKAEEEVGVYSIMFFAAILITIPLRSINRISGVIVSESWKKNDIKNIQDIYSKSALNLLILGAFLFTIGWASIDPVLTFLPEYAYGKYVFFFLGLAKLIELSTGINAEIIVSSKKYKYNTYFNLFLAFFAIFFNYLLIPSYGILGAGFASFLAMTIVNVIRAAFLYKAFKLWPFDLHFLKMVIIVLLFIGLASVLKFDINPIIQIVINVFIITILYWGLVIKLRISPDVNDWIYKMRRKFL